MCIFITWAPTIYIVRLCTHTQVDIHLNTDHSTHIQYPLHGFLLLKIQSKCHCQFKERCGYNLLVQPALGEPVWAPRHSYLFAWNSTQGLFAVWVWSARFCQEHPNSWSWWANSSYWVGSWATDHGSPPSFTAKLPIWSSLHLSQIHWLG